MAACPLRCGRELPIHDSLGVCDTCGWRIAQRYTERILAHDRRQSIAHHETWRQAQREERARIQSDPNLYAAYEQPEGSSFVYYVRLGEHIKIGYTTRVLQRMSALRVPTLDDLLALEPGGRELEGQRHQEFDHLRITKRWENFRPGPDLDQHIATLHETYGMPRWLQSPRRGRNGPVEVRRK